MRKLILLLFVTACTGSQNEELYAESAKIHETASKTGSEVGEKINRMKTFIDFLDEGALKDSIAMIKQDFIDWEKSIVEVPGSEEDEHHHHGHDHSGHNHDHAPPPDLTPEMMLEVQKTMQAQINQLNHRIQNLLETLENLENETVEEK